jgi:hypothetical protein
MSKEYKNVEPLLSKKEKKKDLSFRSFFFSFYLISQCNYLFNSFIYNFL